MAYWDDYFATLLSNPCNAFEQRKNGTINFSVTTWFRAVIKLISLPMLIRWVVTNSSAFIFRYWALSVCHRLRVQQCHTLCWKPLHFADALYTQPWIITSLMKMICECEGVTYKLMKINKTINVNVFKYEGIEWREKKHINIPSLWMNPHIVLNSLSLEHKMWIF